MTLRRSVVGTAFRSQRSCPGGGDGDGGSTGGDGGGGVGGGYRTPAASSDASSTAGVTTLLASSLTRQEYPSSSSANSDHQTHTVELPARQDPSDAVWTMLCLMSSSTKRSTCPSLNTSRPYR